MVRSCASFSCSLACSCFTSALGASTATAAQLPTATARPLSCGSGLASVVAARRGGGPLWPRGGREELRGAAAVPSLAEGLRRPDAERPWEPRGPPGCTGLPMPASPVTPPAARCGAAQEEGSRGVDFETTPSSSARRCSQSAAMLPPAPDSKAVCNSRRNLSPSLRDASSSLSKPAVPKAMPGPCSSGTCIP